MANRNNERLRSLRCQRCHKQLHSHTALCYHQLNTCSLLEGRYFVDAKTCKRCGRVSKDLSGARIHKRKGACRFVCQQCGKRGFTSLRLFTLHVQSHSQALPFKCVHCQRKYPLQSTLRNHLKTCSKLKILFKCPLCSYQPKTWYTALKHNHVCIYPQDGKELVQCPICQTGIRSSTFQMYFEMELLKSKIVDTTSFTIACPICSVKLPNPSLLHTHRMLHTRNLTPLSSVRKPYPCAHCLHTATSFTDMKQHVMSKHNKCVQEKAAHMLALRRMSAQNGSNPTHHRSTQSTTSLTKPPLHRCYICLRRIYCPTYARFHVKCCEDKYT